MCEKTRSFAAVLPARSAAEERFLAFFIGFRRVFTENLGFSRGFAVKTRAAELRPFDFARKLDAGVFKRESLGVEDRWLLRLASCAVLRVHMQVFSLEILNRIVEFVGSFPINHPFYDVNSVIRVGFRAKLIRILHCRVNHVGIYHCHFHIEVNNAEIPA